jgi:hypothetical protein
MIKPTDQEEEKIMSLLQLGLQQSDPVPPDVTDFAKAALSWRNIDAGLAQLSYDSREETTPAGVRGVSLARMLSFETEDVMVDLEYNAAAGRLMGQIEPAHQASIEMHIAGSVVVATADERGRFSFEGVLPGPLALVIGFPDGQRVKTEWIVL